MPDEMTIIHRIYNQASSNPDAQAIVSSGNRVMTYSQLLHSVTRISRLLQAMGLGRTSRVALILRDGPEMIVTFLAVTAIAACAPLNPSYTREELDFYLSDLRVDAVILDDEITSVVQAVQEMDVHVISLSHITRVIDSQDEMDVAVTQGPSFTAPDDIALVLHTSGTTARPKIVPIRQRNICHSMQNIIQSLSLTHSDRCINVMPLFHVHGLIGAVLATLGSGGTILCDSKFIPERFLESLEQFEPTWFTAVPTIHDAIVDEGLKVSPQSRSHSLRFIRSCSSPLLPTVRTKLVDYFQVPVYEAYGMTEAAHQIAIHLQPEVPGTRESVGLPVGCEIAIMDSNGNRLAPHEVGEIVVRGPNVVVGYENNPEANLNSFQHGWFRTGDEGYVDSEGHLFIRGRLKEIINRGGEKVSPLEVDKVLRLHPAVRQAASFAIPHDTLGEDVAVAIVKRTGMDVTEPEIRRFASEHLALFKVPSRVVFCTEIPKGPTGKIQRASLAKKLLQVGTSDGATSSECHQVEQPSSGIQAVIRKIWGDVLRCDHVRMSDNFFELGGNSIQAAQILARVQQQTGVQLSFEHLFNHPVLEELIHVVRTRLDLNEEHLELGAR